MAMVLMQLALAVYKGGFPGKIFLKRSPLMFKTPAATLISLSF